MTKNIIRVRFAPSPTGYLHIGGARTALYNWLFAKHNNGSFILRIEDTDEIRSTNESIKIIIDSLEWLGINWDEGPYFENGLIKEKGNFGPYFQMQRTKAGIYQKYIDILLKEDKAYYCYCNQEELEQMRKNQILNKIPPKYDNRCRNLTLEERKKKELEGRKPVVRFKMPLEGETIFNDLIRGEIKFNNSLLDDFVILKTNGTPTYNFACVIDDYLMNITHVIRGEDHISNTPKQIQLYNALKLKSPEFAHLSIILGPDGSKLSKRHCATSVLEYKNSGYLPQAMFNYLTLLGWSTQESQQIFELNELIEKFSIEKCSKGSAIFDCKKLLWINGEYIRKTDIDTLFEYVKNFLNMDIFDKIKYNYIKKAIALEQEKIKLLTDIPNLIEFFIKENITYNKEAIEKALKKPNIKNILIELKEKILNLDNFNKTYLEKIFREYAKEKNLKTSPIFHAVRVTVSGRLTGPSLFEMLELLGKEVVVKRMDYVINNILSGE